MKTVIKTAAAVITITAAISLFGFVSDVRSLDIGGRASIPMFTVQRTGYAVYKLSTPLGTARINSLYVSSVTDQVLSVLGVANYLAPNTAEVLSGEYSR